MIQTVCDRCKVPLPKDCTSARLAIHPSWPNPGSNWNVGEASFIGGKGAVGYDLCKACGDAVDLFLKER